ncbi:S49 family peptidase [Sorangium sp. So ce145]|uniref:S49 family peptidase n=1 Tax=Sorangium sp. So ce145 TaxID=3133285 RepID=UPI003F5EA9A8
MKVRTFKLDASTLAAARASSVLALHESAIGGIFSLAEEAPPAAGAPAARRERVRVVSISGPLQTRAQQHMCGYADGYDAIVSRAGAALSSGDVDAVVLDVMSPGGDAVGNLEAARRLRQMAQESGKPLLAAVTMGYSAAYALASAAEAIYVLPSGGVGSIGTIAVHVSEARALANEGLDVTILRSDPTKALGHPAEALSEEARAELQRRVDTLGAAFRELVAEHRGLTSADLDELGARTRHGDAAVDAGLADGVGSLDDVVALAAVRAAERAEKKRKDRNMAFSSALPVSLSAPPVSHDEHRPASPRVGVNDAVLAAELGVEEAVARQAREMVSAAMKAPASPAANIEPHRQARDIALVSAAAPAVAHPLASDEVLAFETGADLSVVRMARAQVQAAQQPPSARPLPTAAALAAGEGVSPDVARQALDQVQSALRVQAQG